MTRWKEPIFWPLYGFLAGWVMLGIYYAVAIMPHRGRAPNAPALARAANASPARTPVTASTQGPGAPSGLAAKIENLANAFDGTVGIAIKSVERGWVVGFNSGKPFPQQSVSKLWVAAAIMDRIDTGKLSLGTSIPLTEADLTIFHQPIRKKILAGGYSPALSELLFFALTQSDNSANEALFRRAGGKSGIEGFLASQGLSGISMSEGEKQLQMETAGTVWQDTYSYDRNFWHDRDAVPALLRLKAMSDYLTHPSDGAMPVSIAEALARLKRGELLSTQSTAYLLDLMAKSSTGPERLKSGLSDGWSLAHKTGTGQVLQIMDSAYGIASAYNDVGILTSPNGRHYAIVAMIGSTYRPVPERQALMRGITQAVIDCSC